MKVLSIALLVLAIHFCGNAQDYPYDITKYPYVNYHANHFVIYDSVNYTALFAKLTDVGFKGEHKVSIVHIGDSHIQADFLSGNFRKKLQTFFIGAMGGRGFLFPYKMAKTNNPTNYKVSYSGEWNNCRNVEPQPKCNLGLSGITVFTKDTFARVTISIDDKNLPGYDFDKLMVFHDFSASSYKPIIENAIKVTENRDLGYTLFTFCKNISTLTLRLQKTDSLQNTFNLYGFNFDSSDAGIIYHTVGVNGAKFESYLTGKFFKPHLSALNPDWIIISLGTNDAYTQVFDSVLFAKHVDRLLNWIQQAAPKAAILLTTPGDHRFRKSYINENVAVASRVIKQKAKQHQLSYWDFYTIMGGQGSINAWYYDGLAHTDFLHYTKKGYHYQSQLLFNAFLKAYDNYLEQHMLNQ